MTTETKTPTKVVILANTGFIGKAVFDYLQQSNIISVFGYSSSVVNLKYPDSLNLLDNIIDEQTALILTAVITRDRADTLDAFYTNITMITNVARFLESHRINKCIYLSSVAVYADVEDGLTINENTLTSSNPLFMQERSELYECVMDSVIQSNNRPQGAPEVNPDFGIPKFWVV